jgi:hypothetical protein
MPKKKRRGPARATECKERLCPSRELVPGKALCRPHYNAAVFLYRSKKKAAALKTQLAQQAARKRLALATKAALETAKRQEVAESDALLKAKGRPRFTRSAVNDGGGGESKAKRPKKGPRVLDYSAELAAAGKPLSGLARMGRRGFIADAVRNSGSRAAAAVLTGVKTWCLYTLILAGIESQRGEYAADTFYHEGAWKEATSENTAKRIMFGIPKQYRTTQLLPKYT